MWYHRRTGPNTAVSSPLWMIVAGLLLLLGLAKTAWPVMLLVALGGAAIVLVMRKQDSDIHNEYHRNRLEPGCRWCDREAARLDELDRADQERSRRASLQTRFPPAPRR